MIKIKIDRDQEGKIVAFSGTGHAFYDKVGKDIVCAAVSTLIHHSILALGKYLNIDLEVKKNKEQGFLSVRIRCLMPELREKADIVLESLCLSLIEIEKQYKGHLEIKNNKFQEVDNCL